MQVRFKHADNGVVGACHIPTGIGVITVAGVGDSRTEALARAALVAEKIASDPVLSAIMPPGTLAAIKATKGLAAASAAGIKTLKGFWRGLRGPGKKRLAEALAVDHRPDNGEVGIWNPFKRKRRRPVRRPPPMRREPEPEEEEEPEEAPEQIQGGPEVPVADNGVPLVDQLYVVEGADNMEGDDE